MNKSFQELGEKLNKYTNDEMFIRIGRYESEEITGELFVKTNSDTIFRVFSDDSSKGKDFNIIPDEAIVTPVDKELENSKIKYEEIDINNKSSLRAWFPKTKEGIEMFDCVQSVPLRFRYDALDLFHSPNDDMWDMYTIDKSWTYFLEDILNEMTEKEMEIYGFG